MTKVFKKWWLAKIAASIHFKDQSYSACFFYMAGRLDYWKCQKKEWSAKMLSFHHSLKLRYMFAKQVASIGIQWAISPPLPFYQGLMSEPPSPMDWMLPKATPKMAVFRDHKRGKKKRLHWTGWNLKKMGWQQFFFPRDLRLIEGDENDSMILTPWVMPSHEKIPKRTYWLGVCPEMSYAKESLSCSKRKSKMRKNGNFDTLQMKK